MYFLQYCTGSLHFSHIPADIRKCAIIRKNLFTKIIIKSNIFRSFKFFRWKIMLFFIRHAWYHFKSQNHRKTFFYRDLIFGTTTNLRKKNVWFRINWKHYWRVYLLLKWETKEFDDTESRHLLWTFTKWITDSREHNRIFRSNALKRMF